MQMEPTFTKGNVVVFRASGMARVEGRVEFDVHGQRAAFYEVSEASQRSLVPVEKAAEMLRNPVTEAEAREMLALLKLPGVNADDRPWEERFAELLRVIEVGTPMQHAAILRRLYATAATSHGDEDRLATAVGLFEDLVLSELAHVLHTPRGQIERELRALHPAAMPPESANSATVRS